jgi:hypothetical protein
VLLRQTDLPIERPLFTMVPIWGDTTSMGFLYLEGAESPVGRVTDLLMRCAALAARVLAAERHLGASPAGTR